MHTTKYWETISFPLHVESVEYKIIHESYELKIFWSAQNVVVNPKDLREIKEASSITPFFPRLDVHAYIQFYNRIS